MKKQALHQNRESLSTVVGDQEWQAQARLLGLAAAMYLQPPTSSSLSQCQAAGLELAAWLPLERFPRRLAEATDGEMEAVIQEYYDLFFVPISGRYCPPYEAAQLAGTLGGGIDQEVREFYQAAGFSLASLELPSFLKALNRADYMGFELAFLASLAASLATADQPPPDRRENLLHALALFAGQHFCRWANLLGEKIVARAESAYFQGCGELTMYLARLLAEATADFAPPQGRIGRTDEGHDHQRALYPAA